MKGFALLGGKGVPSTKTNICQFTLRQEISIRTATPTWLPLA